MTAVARPEPAIAPNASQATLVLRTYQETSVAAIRAAFAEQHRRVLFVLPTGGGKTVIFSFITSAAMALGHRVIVLAHRQEIVDQISAALDRDGRAARAHPAWLRAHRRSRASRHGADRRAPSGGPHGSRAAGD